MHNEGEIDNHSGRWAMTCSEVWETARPHLFLFFQPGVRGEAPSTVALHNTTPIWTSFKSSTTAFDERTRQEPGNTHMCRQARVTGCLGS
jgi:hypothetical protein